jgi:hypothetical protein
VAGGRLSQTELEELLAVEAKGAARSLRSDTGADPSLDLEPEDRPSTSLLLLDRVSDLPLEPVFIDAPISDRHPKTTIEKQAEVVATRPGELAPQTRGRVRRGRIDLAALLYEFAPQGRLAIEPGSGTEVVGNEEDLRRVLQLMVLQSPTGFGVPAADKSVEVRREGDWIRVSVDLGPDISLVDEAERRWLHRTAIRHGGRFELRGRTQCLLLPADASAHAEVVALQRELEQAQLLGESYARELASVISQEPPRVPGALTEAVPILELALRELQRSSPNSVGIGPLRTLLQALGRTPEPSAVVTNPKDLERTASDAAARLAAAFSVRPKPNKNG